MSAGEREARMSKKGLSDREWPWLDKIIAYAKENPIKFVSFVSFLALGAIPIVTFLGYSAAAVIASCIVSIVVDLFIISIGAIGLSFVLFFVTCMTVCATSVFAGFYYTYRIASGAVSNGFRLSEKSTWPPAPE